MNEEGNLQRRKAIYKGGKVIHDTLKNETGMYTTNNNSSFVKHPHQITFTTSGQK